jgi:signal transduction histidine kinase
MTLRARFEAYFTILVFAILSAASLFFYYSQKAQILEQIQIQQRQALRSLVKVCQEALLANEDIALLNYLMELTGRKEISAADLVGTDGKILAHPDPAQLGRKIEFSTETPYLYTAQVMVQDKTVGEARLAFNPELIGRQIETGLKRSMKRFLQSVVLGSLIFGLLAAVLTATQLTRPIRLLADGARRIGEGKLSHRISLERPDELGQLAGEFNQMAVRLGELDRMKQEFMHSITHDLRNPLNCVIGYSDFLLMNRHELKDKQVRAIELILSSSKQLNDMISEILDLAKFEAGMMKLKVTQEDLCAMLREVHQMFAATAAQKGISLGLRREVAEAPVTIDAPLVRRVIQNFLSNALKFTPKGGTVTLEVEKMPEGGVCCAVKDNGPGIPPEHLKLMFQKFQQVPGIEATKAERGTGIGLALSKSVIEAHGGRVGIDTAVGQGSRFYFVLPASKV